MTNKPFAIEMSLAELKRHAARWGYTVTNSGDKLEARPRGTKPGTDQSLHASGEGARWNLLQTIKAEALCGFRTKLNALPDEIDGMLFPKEAKDALCAWYEYHASEWLEILIYQAWMNGRYDGDSTHHYSGTLQRLRNTNGHKVLALLKPGAFR